MIIIMIPPKNIKIKEKKNHEKESFSNNTLNLTEINMSRKAILKGWDRLAQEKTLNKIKVKKNKFIIRLKLKALIKD